MRVLRSSIEGWCTSVQLEAAVEIVLGRNSAWRCASHRETNKSIGLAPDCCDTRDFITIINKGG